ncbi:MAG: quinolinate synthase NadA [Oscillospiraceae bacterium]|nr:quinolinate synthase NadA [Oscillospiraceae bacterium]
MQLVIDRIKEYKQQHNAIIAAHTYQPPEIQELADIVGDSFALAEQAAASGADTVIVCGVRFMAEGIKLLAPEKTVILAAPAAGCPMACRIDPERVARFRTENPDAAVVAYINTTAELKAEADVCVTSSSAVKIVSALPQRRILFIPDQHLGEYIWRQVPAKEIITWEGYCPVHHAVTAADLLAAKTAHPGALVAAHPECAAEVLALADFVGSTSGIIDYIGQRKEEIIVVTERGVVDLLNTRYPGRLHQLVPEKLTCPDMKLVTADTLLAVIGGAEGEIIELDPELAGRARASLIKMIALGT